MIPSWLKSLTVQYKIKDFSLILCEKKSWADLSFLSNLASPFKQMQNYVKSLFFLSITNSKDVHYFLHF